MQENELHGLSNREPLPLDRSEHLSESVEITRIDQEFVEEKIDELLWLFSHIKGVGAHYDNDMLLRQQRFGGQLSGMWEHSEAILDRVSGSILNVLFASVMTAGDEFQSRIQEDSGQEIGSRRLYISELQDRMKRPETKDTLVLR